jgi:hypothetical protein
MKKIRGDKPVGAIIYGNITRKLPMQLSLSQTSKNVMLFSFLSFLFFNSTKLEKRRSERVLLREEGWH